MLRRSLDDRDQLRLPHHRRAKTAYGNSQTPKLSPLPKTPRLGQTVAPISHEGTVSTHWRMQSGPRCTGGASAGTRSRDSQSKAIQVLYDYSASSAGVLSLREGEVAFLEAVKDRGWCVLRTGRGERGYFPQTYVGAISSDIDLPTSAEGSAEPSNGSLVPQRPGSGEPSNESHFSSRSGTPGDVPQLRRGGRWVKDGTFVCGNICETWVDRLNKLVSTRAGMCASCEDLVGTIKSERAREIEALRVKHLQTQAALRTQLKIEKQARAKSEHRMLEMVQEERDRGVGLSLHLKQAELRLQAEIEAKRQLEQEVRRDLEDKEEEIQSQAAEIRKLIEEKAAHQEELKQDIDRHKKLVEEAQEAAARMESESQGGGTITNSTKQMLRRTVTTLQREVNAESAEAQRLQDEFDRDQADVERLAQVRQSHLRHHAGHLDELAPRLFQSLDTDGDGKLSEPELRAALSANALSAAGSAFVKEISASEARQSNQNYKKLIVADKKHGFVGIFGDNAEFHLGLHKFNGGPTVSGSEALENAMEQEFRDYGKNARSGDGGLVRPDELLKLRSIETSNYGNIKSDLDIEWEFAAAPNLKRIPLYPGQEGNTKKDPATGKAFPGRTPIPIEQLMKHPLCKRAGLTRPETIGLRLYTGPAYTKLNGALRHCIFQKNLEDRRQRVLEDKPPNAPEICFSTTCAVINSAIVKLLAHTPLAGTEADPLVWVEISAPPTGGQELTIPKLAEALPFKTEFTREEWAAFEHSVLGLKWEKWVGKSPPAHGEMLQGPKDKILKLQTALKKKTELTAKEWQELGISDLQRCSYVRSFNGDCFLRPTQQDLQVSLHDFIEANVRGVPTLFKPARAKHTHRTLYRGISRMCFDDNLLDVGIGKPPQSFVERGFSSATPVKEVALQYAGAFECKGPLCDGWVEGERFCSNHLSTLLEIKTGHVDRGASLQWVSQFPAENEHVILPLSNFEIIGMRRDSVGGAVINVLEISLNINLNAQKLCDLQKTRQRVLLDAFDNSMHKLTNDLTQQLDSKGLKTNIEALRIVSKTLQECDEAKRRYDHNELAQRFNDDDGFYQLALQEAANLHRNAMAKFAAFSDTGLLDIKTFAQLGMSRWSSMSLNDGWREYRAAAAAVEAKTARLKALLSDLSAGADTANPLTAPAATRATILPKQSSPGPVTQSRGAISPAANKGRAQSPAVDTSRLDDQDVENEIIIGVDAATGRVNVWSDKAREIFGVTREEVLADELRFVDREDLVAGTGSRGRGWGIREALDVALLLRPRELATAAVESLSEADIEELQAFAKTFAKGDVPVPSSLQVLQAVSILTNAPLIPTATQGRRDREAWRALLTWKPAQLLEAIKSVDPRKPDPHKVHELEDVLESCRTMDGCKQYDKQRPAPAPVPEPAALKRLHSWCRALQDCARNHVVSVEVTMMVKGERHDMLLTVATRRANDSQLLGALISAQELNERQASALKLITHRGLVPAGQPHAAPGGSGGSSGSSSALIHAVCTGNLSDVKLLLDASSSAVDQTDLQGYSALFFSVIYGSQEIADELLARGASLKTSTLAGESIIHVASRFGRGEMLGVLQGEVRRRCGGSEEAAHAEVQALVLPPAITSTSPGASRGKTKTGPGSSHIDGCLHLASRYGHHKIAEALAHLYGRHLLLQQDQGGHSALHVAAERGNMQVALALLAAASRANCQLMLLRQAVRSIGNVVGASVVGSSRKAEKVTGQREVASLMDEKLALAESKVGLMLAWLRVLKAGDGKEKSAADAIWCRVQGMVSQWSTELGVSSLSDASAGDTISIATNQNLLDEALLEAADAFQHSHLAHLFCAARMLAACRDRRRHRTEWLSNPERLRDRQEEEEEGVPGKEAEVEAEVEAEEESEASSDAQRASEPEPQDAS